MLLGLKIVTGGNHTQLINFPCGFFHLPKNKQKKHDLSTYCAGELDVRSRKKTKGFPGERRSIIRGSRKSSQKTWKYIYIYIYIPKVSS